MIARFLPHPRVDNSLVILYNSPRFVAEGIYIMTNTLSVALQIIQIIISIFLVVVVILQARGQGLGSLFGSSDAGMGITKTRRGLERTLFQITIILAMLFLINAVVQLMLQGGQ